MALAPVVTAAKWIGPNELEVTWTPSTEGTVGGYSVNISKDGGKTWQNGGSWIQGRGASQVVLVELDQTVAYQVRMRSITGSSPGNIVSVAAVENNEQAEKEAKEKVEREAHEKAEHEAAEKQAKEKAEKEAKEKVEREAKERSEREAREKAEREKKEKEEAEKPHEEEPSTRVPVNFPAMKSVADWKHNELCLAKNSYLWKLVSEATVHSASAKYVTALKEVAGSITSIVYTTNATNDWGFPDEIGSSSDPAETIADSYSTAPNFHNHGKVKANNNSDASLSLIDGPTGRERGVSPYGDSLHDLMEGQGFSANSKSAEIPFVTGSKAIVAGQKPNAEVGGATSARMASVPMLLRFQELKRSDENPYDAILHPLAALIAKGTMCARGNSTFGYGINANPSDTRNPYVSPAQQGETPENAGKNTYAPPMGMWFALNWTQKEIEAMTSVPSFIKAIYMGLARSGAIFVDVQGSPGIRFYNESLRSYTEIGDNTASEWLKKKTDGKFLKESGGVWTLDITGGGTMTSSIFSALKVLAPSS